MEVQGKLFLLAIFFVVLFKISNGSDASFNVAITRNFTSTDSPKVQEPIQNIQEPTQNGQETIRYNSKIQELIEKRIRKERYKQRLLDCKKKSIRFITTDNKGNYNEQGQNHVIIFDPKAKDLDFKVNLGISHKLYAKDENKNFRQEYQPKLFRELISDENSTLNGKEPIAAINGDYIDVENKPQGFNISRGVEYSGEFKDKRSSFAISGGNPGERIATIQIGRRNEDILNYNAVGGNGRFYNNGKFKNICKDLGDYACGEEVSRSMAAITSKGYVIFLVNSANKLEKALYPSMFDDVLKGIGENYCLGDIQEGMLFDGGFSTNLYFDQKIYVENPRPLGSVFLIYQKGYSASGQK